MADVCKIRTLTSLARAQYDIKSPFSVINSYLLIWGLKRGLLLQKVIIVKNKKEERKVESTIPITKVQTIKR